MKVHRGFHSFGHIHTSCSEWRRDRDVTTYPNGHIQPYHHFDPMTRTADVDRLASLCGACVLEARPDWREEDEQEAS